MAEISQHCQDSLTERERMAEAADWYEVARDARGDDEAALAVRREVQRNKAAASLPPNFLSEIIYVQDQHLRLTACRAATLELVAGFRRFVLSRWLRWRNLARLLDASFPSLTVKALRQVRGSPLVRRALGFTCAATAQVRNLP